MLERLAAYPSEKVRDRAARLVRALEKGEKEFDEELDRGMEGYLIVLRAGENAAA